MIPSFDIDCAIDNENREDLAQRFQTIYDNLLQSIADLLGL
jgi:hypothetical protein